MSNRNTPRRTPLQASQILLLLAVTTPAFTQIPLSPPGAPPGLSVTPKNGQTEQQQWSDRYACHNWAKSQSGFDPTRPASGTVAPEQAESQRDQYRRAMAACLEARGYSVRFGSGPGSSAPPPAAPAPVPPPTTPPLAAAPQVAQHYDANELRYHPLTIGIEGGYTLAEGAVKSSLDDTGNVGLGITWHPSASLPLGFRVDGSYSRFSESAQSRALVSAATGTNVAFGHEQIYGGDADAELDLPMGPRAREYFFGGAGWYREHVAFKQLSYEQGEICWFYCWQGYVPVVSTLARSTSPWRRSWNAGMGVEFALSDPATFFIEARYLRIEPYSPNTAFVPIRIGLRF